MYLLARYSIWEKSQGLVSPFRFPVAHIPKANANIVAERARLAMMMRVDFSYSRLE